MSDRAYLNDHRGYIGTSGSGKSTTARVDVEKLLEERRHTGIIDLTGIWYGLRSDRAGTGPGFDIPIFGGRRGDVPIGAGDGGAIGRIVGDGVSAIVDLSALRSGADQRLFLAEFIASIRAKPHGHFQLICDEADEYIPEKGGIRDSMHAQVLEDMIWIAKRGRTDGFVLSIITQRLADVANAAFSQVQTIFAHQLTAPSDIDAFGKYVKRHGTREELAEIMGGLPSLGVGQRYLYRPRLHILELGRTPLPATFDSSRSPEPGEARREPRLLSQIDVAAIAAALKKPAEEKAAAAFDAGAEVGQLLIEKDARIRELENQVEELGRSRATWMAVCDNYQRTFGDAIALLEAARDGHRLPNMHSANADMHPGDADLHEIAGSDRIPTPFPPGPDPAGEGEALPHSASPTPRPRAAPAGDKPVHPLAPILADRMDAIAPARMTWRQLASMCGYSPDGGYFRGGKRDALARGLLIEESGFVRSPKEGASGLTRSEAFDLWKSILPAPAPLMMDQLLKGPMTKVRLADILGYSTSGGYFRSGLRFLRDNGVTTETEADVALAVPLPGEARR